MKKSASSSRREFIQKLGASSILASTFPMTIFSNDNTMKKNKDYDVIIVGGSYSGLAAAMALGRALRKVLIIDSGSPCNKQTPYSHNFITQDGKTPAEISSVAKNQVENYTSVQFFDGLASKGSKTKEGFEITVQSGEVFTARKLVFATGIKDIMPVIDGFTQCWGISVLHCPYCHGYEVRNEPTGILGNGDYGFEFSGLISNWTKDITLFTNGKSTLTPEQHRKIKGHGIEVIESEIERIDHEKGYIKHIHLKDGSTASVKALYARLPFTQHCPIPIELGCTLTDEGYLQIDPSQKTSVDGIYACGDNTTRMRTVANAVSMGTTAGMMLNKEFVLNKF